MLLKKKLKKLKNTSLFCLFICYVIHVVVDKQWMVKRNPGIIVCCIPVLGTILISDQLQPPSGIH